MKTQLPKKTPEQLRMEKWYRAYALRRSSSWVFVRNKDGEYTYNFARIAWAAWQAAQYGAPKVNASRLALDLPKQEPQSEHDEHDESAD
jgi:hypothetical protein